MLTKCPSRRTTLLTPESTQRPALPSETNREVQLSPSLEQDVQQARRRTWKLSPLPRTGFSPMEHGPRPPPAGVLSPSLEKDILRVSDVVFCTYVNEAEVLKWLGSMTPPRLV